MKAKKKHPRIRKDDKVVVTVGKDKGKIGTVLRLESDSERVVVEKTNMVKRNTKPSPNTGQGGVIEKEAPLHISKLMLVCSKCAEPTRVGKKELGDGSRVRVCKKCGEALDE